MIFEFDDYKKFTLDELKRRHGRVHGQLSLMARALGLSSTMMSQIFRGPKQLTLEHGIKLSDHLGLSREETEYFLLLVQKERAGSMALQREFERQIQRARNQALQVRRAVKKDLTLSQEEQKIFYSSWEYSAARLACELPQIKNLNDLSVLLGIPVNKLQQIMNFLLQTGLTKRKTQGYELGPAVTYVGEDSPFLQNHHRNWRIRSMERWPHRTPRELFFTASMSLSEEDAEKIRAKLFELISEITSTARASKPETMRALVLDWMLFQ